MVAWLGLWAGGCADAGIDREDELGTATDGRYELVVLEPVEGQSDSTADLSPAPANIAVFFDPDGSFTVQVGVYRDVDRAEQLVRDLKDQGYPAYGARSPEGMRVPSRLVSSLRGWGASKPRDTMGAKGS